MLLRCLLICLAMVLSAPLGAQEREQFVVEIGGAGAEVRSFTADDMASLDRVEQTVTFETSKGPSTGRYEGVLLWNLLAANGMVNEVGHGAELRRTFVVRARDGYEVAFSIGEIHPDFGAKLLMLADSVDGKPIDGGYRMIVPGDKRGARNVREVVSIELR